MVDFAYIGEIEWPPLRDQIDNDEIAQQLDDMLDLLQATDMWALDRLHEIVEDHILDHSDL